MTGLLLGLTGLTAFHEELVSSYGVPMVFSWRWQFLACFTYLALVSWIVVWIDDSHDACGMYLSTWSRGVAGRDTCRDLSLDMK